MKIDASERSHAKLVSAKTEGLQKHFCCKQEPNWARQTTGDHEGKGRQQGGTQREAAGGNGMQLDAIGGNGRQQRPAPAHRCWLQELNVKAESRQQEAMGGIERQRKATGGEGRQQRPVPAHRFWPGTGHLVLYPRGQDP